MYWHPADLVRAARSAAGFTQRELAAKAKTSQSAIARIERGQLSPTFATLQRILGTLGGEVGLVMQPRRSSAESPPVEAATPLHNHQN